VISPQNSLPPPPVCRITRCRTPNDLLFTLTVAINKYEAPHCVIFSFSCHSQLDGSKDCHSCLSVVVHKWKFSSLTAVENIGHSQQHCGVQLQNCSWYQSLGNALYNHKQIRVLQDFPRLSHELKHQLFKKKKKRSTRK
jgi:hypothetical protein